VQVDVIPRNNTLPEVVKRNNYKFVELLVSKGADVNAKDNDGRTPLHDFITGAEAPAETIKFLVSQGADVNAQDENGKTPLGIINEAKGQDTDWDTAWDDVEDLEETKRVLREAIAN
jgi:hypothetical protein